MVGTFGRAAALVFKFFKRKWPVVLGACVLLAFWTIHDLNRRLELLQTQVNQHSATHTSATSNKVPFGAAESRNGNSNAHQTEHGALSNLMSSPRPNFAAFPAGANVLPSWTSPTWYHYLKSQSMFINKHSKVEGNPPIVALLSDLSLGTCWSFLGERGQIGIQLARVIWVTGITISHVSRALAYDIRTAPNKFELWGLGFDGEDNLDLLHSGAYDINAAQNVQYFEVSSPKTRSYSKVLVKIRSNHGNRDLTCVYQIRIHGEPCEKLDGIGNLPEELNYLVPT
ncbi:hypothetical protein PGT21_017151 [Puccinia graminis f. sp. tritici]|uniref:SUN domain-containing protein n=1 Tax=Puccinia graminis f. sp. tritici TaxID=56615 RepID=A0A5B0MUL3_PUCGR|nr:hypothetical protein PGT21_017151 [Puccinia graminis f. sp. tritici]KAA1092041.1 hypothetical protein PGTUg99_004649 [Puccinia graminis f. sp. tritici]